MLYFFGWRAKRRSSKSEQAEARTLHSKFFPSYEAPPIRRSRIASYRGKNRMPKNQLRYLLCAIYRLTSLTYRVVN